MQKKQRHEITICKVVQCDAGHAGGCRKAHTALPVWVAHLQVTASACGVLLGTIWADDALNLLAQGLEGGVDLKVTVAHHVGIIGTEVTEGIRGFLLWLGNEADVKSTTRGSRRSRGSGRSRGSLIQTINQVKRG